MIALIHAKLIRNKNRLVSLRRETVLFRTPYVNIVTLNGTVSLDWEGVGRDYQVFFIALYSVVAKTI